MHTLYKKIFFALALFFLSIPQAVSAHVKWFVFENSIAPVRNYHISDMPVIAWVIITLVLIFIGVFLEKKLPTPRKISHPFFDYIDPIIISLFSIMVGIGFIAFSFLGYIFAPVYEAHQSFTFLLQIIQMIIGFGLVLGIFTQFFSILLFILYIAFGIQFGFLSMLENINILGIAAMLLLSIKSHWVLFNSHTLEVFTNTYRRYAVPLLRVFVGLNLIILGFSEKILHPELGMTFLQIHSFNFMQGLGFLQYSDYWFVLSAGVVEVLFGIVFVLGIVTRINAIAIGSFFVATLLLLGPVELFGHILHFAIIIVLLVFGSGTIFKLIRKK